MITCDVSRVRAMTLSWCTTCERWFHRPVHNCDEWQRPVDRSRLNDGLTD